MVAAEQLVEIGMILSVVFKEEVVQVVVVMELDLVVHRQMVIQEYHLLVQQILAVAVEVALMVQQVVQLVVKESL